MGCGMHSLLLYEQTLLDLFHHNKCQGWSANGSLLCEEYAVCIGNEYSKKGLDSISVLASLVVPNTYMMCNWFSFLVNSSASTYQMGVSLSACTFIFWIIFFQFWNGFVTHITQLSGSLKFLHKMHLDNFWETFSHFLLYLCTWSGTLSLRRARA